MIAITAAQQRDAGLGAAMIAHAMMNDDAAVEMLACEHDDPAALAIAVAHAAAMVIMLTSMRPGQSDLFELDLPHLYARRMARDGAESTA